MSTTLKTCRECAMPLPLVSFYRHASMADGFLNKCKECVKARVTRHRNKNIEKMRLYDNLRSKTPARKARLYRNCRKFRKEFPEKYRAHNMVSNAVRDGRLEKPDACEKCDRKGHVLHGHHDDYEKQLDVKWLCPACHSARHKEINAAYIKSLNIGAEII